MFSKVPFSVVLVGLLTVLGVAFGLQDIHDDSPATQNSCGTCTISNNSTGATLPNSGNGTCHWEVTTENCVTMNCISDRENATQLFTIETCMQTPTPATITPTSTSPHIVVSTSTKAPPTTTVAAPTTTLGTTASPTTKITTTSLPETTKSTSTSPPLVITASTVATVKVASVSTQGGSIWGHVIGGLSVFAFVLTISYLAYRFFKAKRNNAMNYNRFT